MMLVAQSSGQDVYGHFIEKRHQHQCSHFNMFEMCHQHKDTMNNSE